MRLKSQILTLTLVAFVYASNGQAIKDKRTLLLESIQTKSSHITTKSQDTAFLRIAAEFYGDSILIQIDNFLSDTALIKKLDTTAEKNKTIGMLSKHKIEDYESWVGPMNDYGNIFSNSELKYLDSMLYNHFENTGTLVSIVTLDSSILKDKNFNDLLTTIQEKWEICSFNKKDILIGVLQQPIKLKIVTCSQNSEKLSVEKCVKIVNELMIPLFVQKKYFEGTKKGLLEILSQIE